MYRALAVMLVVGAGSTARAQAPQACSLMTDAEVEQVIGRALPGDPEPLSLSGGVGSMCSYGETTAGIIVYSGPRAEEFWNNHLRMEKRDKEPRHPAPAAGDDAYLIYLRPQNKYQDAGAMVALKVGSHRVSVFVAAATGAPAESVQPNAIALARAVAPKLR
jgi:hypothetical protein